MKSLNIITPCYKEDISLILRNIQSVKNQKKIFNVKHYCIFDGINRLNEILKFIKGPNTLIFNSRFNHADYGDYIRKLGTRISVCNKVNAIGFLDADNTFESNHFETILETHLRTKKNIIITKRRLIDKNNKILNTKHDKFFDTNTLTFFNESMKIGLLWAKYPNQLSLIGDRIISHYLKTYHTNQIAYTEKITVNYSFSKISKLKQKKFKIWYEKEYKNFREKFMRDFGFDLTV